MGISTVLLAYREAENLRVLLPEIQNALRQTGEAYEIIVVDTAQPLDDTPAVCEQHGVRYVNQTEPKFGGAFRTGIAAASMDKFLILDSDGSHDPGRIPDIYRTFCQGADLVIGSRYVAGGQTNDSKSSIILSRILNTIFRLALGIKAQDISTDFRMYRTDQLKAVQLTSANYDVLQEVLVRLKVNKPDLDIREVPIHFTKRMFGESKRQLLPFAISYLRTLFRLVLLRVASGNYRRNDERVNERVEWLRNAFLYLVFGAIAAVVDFSVFSLGNHLTASRSPEFVNVISAGAGFVTSYLLNTYVNFCKTDRYVFRFASYLGICLIGVGVSTAMIYGLKPLMNLSVLKIIAMLVAAALQFVLNKLITYRK